MSTAKERKFINDELVRWMEERNMTYEIQQKGIVSNLLEETMELSRANTVEEMIDALCDFLIYSATALPSIDITVEDVSECVGLVNNDMLLTPDNIEPIRGYAIDELCQAIRTLVTIKFDLFEDYDNSTSLLSNQQLEDIRREYTHNVHVVIGIIEILGYDYNKCLSETLKEIHSRKGSYDPTIKKFVKEAVPSIPRYTADYISCKK